MKKLFIASLLVLISVSAMAGSFHLTTSCREEYIVAYPDNVDLHSVYLLDTAMAIDDAVCN